MPGSASVQRSIWSTGVLNSIAISIRVLSAFALNKILAVAVGPVGYASIGQFQNVFGLLNAFTANAFSNGVVKYTAQHDGELEAQRKIWGTSVGLTFLLSLVAGAIVIIWRARISEMLAGSGLLSAALVLLGFTNFASACNALLQAVLSGKRELPRFVVSVILGSISAALVTGLMAHARGIEGALFGIALSPLVGLCCSILVCRKAAWFTVKNIFVRPEGVWSARLLAFGVMSATSAILLSSSQLAVRSAVANYEGSASAGLIQALWKISELYLTFFGSTLSIYLLPRIARKDPAATRAEVRKCLVVLIPFSVVVTLVIQFGRFIIIPLLFSRDFLPMSEYIGLQFIGDTVRVAGVILAYVMLGLTMTRSYLFAEIIYFTLYTLLSIAMLHQMGLRGVLDAYIITNVVYVVLAAALLWKQNRSHAVERCNG